MTTKITKISLLVSLLAISTLLTGCGVKKIFREEGEEYKLVALTDKKLEVNKYYVKDATTFYIVHEVEGNNEAKAVSKKADSKRLIWTTVDDSLIPSMYEDGLIAYKSKDSTLSDVNIERYKDIGWSFGIEGAEIDADGYIQVDYSMDAIKNSNFYDTLKEYSSYSIRIISINEEPAKDKFDPISGIITGLENNKTYMVEMYVGTEYKTVNITADVHLYQSYEMYYVESSIDTKNGYVAIELPDGINSGYYNVNGAGLFKYYNTKKGEADLNQDMNIAYYKSAADAITANSQAYVVGIEQLTKNVEFKLEYETDSYKDDDIVIYLTAPNGNSYEMTPIAGYAITEIEEAIAGRWTINIMPKDLVITSVEATAQDVYEDAIKENYSVELETGTNILINVPYEGEGTVWGTASDEDGNAYEFEVDTQNKKLSCVINYVSGGMYDINIYHYADTNIKEPEVTTDEEAESTDVIIVESD